MDFFKSVFSSDPDPSDPPRQDEEEQDDAGESAHNPKTPPAAADSAAAVGGGGGRAAWNFGGLIQTFASKSESVIQTCRRDLEEFGSGLKKETVAIREAATRVVKDLPGSLEVGASVAQDSLESVGQAIDDFGGSVWRGTSEIISHGKEALLSTESDAGDQSYYSDPGQQNPAGASKRYNRFEVQVLAIQSDPSTFSEEPEDAEDFQKWKAGFDLAEKEEEIENLCYENGGLEALFEKLVPGSMDYDTFWSRYYYRVYKLKQAEDARANLVKRVISGEEEEELSWEVDDDDYEEETKKEVIREEIKEEEEEEEEEEEKEEKGENEKEEEETVAKEEIVGAMESVEEKKPAEDSKVENLEVVADALLEELPSRVDMTDTDVPDSGDSISKTEDKMLPEAKVEGGESCKDSDFSVVSSQPSMPEEDDLEWDEIEDLGEHDDKKVNGSGRSPNKVDLRKRLSAAEEDEDLSWDIEDDDEPPKP